MLYQKLLAGADPYFAAFSTSTAFELHCHPEIEFSYCFQGSYPIVIDKTEYILNEGDLAIVNPMVPHELKNDIAPQSLRLTLEIGPAFLGEHFASLVSMNRGSNILLLKRGSHASYYKELSESLDDTARLLQKKDMFFPLMVKANLYKISSVLLHFFAQKQQMPHPFKSSTDVEKIGLAVDMIHNYYNTPLSLDEVSSYCGYSKSNFCKLFKDITGESFHVLLNRHRIDVACLRLREPTPSIEEIALSVGFSDSKSFCRVFKKVIGKTAGEFRKTIQE